MDGLVRREMRLPINRVQFWSDSMIVLQYIKNTTKRFQTFVANRLAIIHECTSPDEWCYVPTDCNPADDASRGIGAGEIHRWLEGPEFLRKTEEMWPETQWLPTIDSEDKEVKKEVQVCTVVVSEKDPVEMIIERYSSWHRAGKAVAWWIHISN